jgi:hypothetical protein
LLSGIYLLYKTKGYLTILAFLNKTKSFLNDNFKNVLKEETQISQTYVPPEISPSIAKPGVINILGYSAWKASLKSLKK